MASLFTRIVNGELPCHRLLEDDNFLAFLDVRPIARGHSLVIPKQEIDYIFDVEDDLLGKSMVFAKRVARGIEKVVPCKRIGCAIIGLEVPHAHIHLVPINKGNDIDFSRAQDGNPEELAELAEKIRNSL